MPNEKKLPSFVTEYRAHYDSERNVFELWYTGRGLLWKADRKSGKMKMGGSFLCLTGLAGSYMLVHKNYQIKVAIRYRFNGNCPQKHAFAYFVK